MANYFHKFIYYEEDNAKNKQVEETFQEFLKLFKENEQIVIKMLKLYAGKAKEILFNPLSATPIPSKAPPLEVLIKILQYQNNFFQTVKIMAKEEIANKGEVFLRGNTAITTILRLFQIQFGRLYYSTALTPLVSRISSFDFVFEDVKVKEKEERTKLSKIYADILDQLLDIPVPMEISIICWQISMALKEENAPAYNFASNDQLSVGLILFLYAICPTFIASSTTQEKIETKRNLVFIAKIMQSLANGSSYNEYEKLNSFNFLLDDNRKTFNKFVSKVILCGSLSFSSFNFTVQNPFAYCIKFMEQIKENMEELNNVLNEEQQIEIKKAIEEVEPRLSLSSLPLSSVLLSQPKETLSPTSPTSPTSPILSPTQSTSILPSAFSLISSSTSLSSSSVLIPSSFSFLNNNSTFNDAVNFDRLLPLTKSHSLNTPTYNNNNIDHTEKNERGEIYVNNINNNINNNIINNNHSCKSNNNNNNVNKHEKKGKRSHRKGSSPSPSPSPPLSASNLSPLLSPRSSSPLFLSSTPLKRSQSDPFKVYKNADLLLSSSPPTLISPLTSRKKKEKKVSEKDQKEKKEKTNKDNNNNNNNKENNKVKEKSKKSKREKNDKKEEKSEKEKEKGKEKESEGGSGSATTITPRKRRAKSLAGPIAPLSPLSLKSTLSSPPVTLPSFELKYDEIIHSPKTGKIKPKAKSTFML